MHMMAAVQLAEALSAAQPQGKQPVAIGTLEPAADSAYSASDTRKHINHKTQ